MSLNSILNHLGYELKHLRKDHDFMPYHLHQLIQKYSINKVLDIGARDGSLCELLRKKAHYEGPICSFESHPDHYKLLSEKSKRDYLWQVFPYYLSDTNGVKKIDGHGGEQLEVASRRLDDLMEALLYEVVGPRVFLRINVESSQKKILDGLGDSLEYVVAISLRLCFSSQSENDFKLYAPSVLEKFYEKGFYLTGAFPRGRNPDTLEVRQFDSFLARRIT